MRVLQGIAIIIIIILIYVVITHYINTGTGKDDDIVKEDNKCDQTPFTSNGSGDWINKVGENDKAVNSPDCYKTSKCDKIMESFEIFAFDDVINSYIQTNKQGLVLVLDHNKGTS